MTTINTAKSKPAYQQIEDDLRAKVRDGRLPAGTMLAGRHALAREYGVALSTAQQAVARLLADGVLETSDRRGTFVAQARAGAQTGTAPAARQTGAMLGIVATAWVRPATSPDVGSAWARLAIRSLEQGFSAAGGTTQFFDRYPEARSQHPTDQEEPDAVPLTDAIQSLLSAGVDAIAVIGLCDAEDMSDAVVSVVDVERVPVVYISWHEIAPPLAQVFYDNRYAGYQAARHLLSKGYERLLFLAPFADTWLAERVEGARDAVRHAGLPQDTLCIHPGGTPAEFYDQAVSDRYAHVMAPALFAESGSTPGPTGIIAPNDVMASAILGAAAECGLSAGVDFGLIGFDDDARSCAAGLTTIRPPVEAMGEEAARLLLRALHGDKKSFQVRLRSQVIPRASTVLHSKIGLERRA